MYIANGSLYIVSFCYHCVVHVDIQTLKLLPCTA